MRATIHLVSREDYWPFAIAIRDGAARALAALPARPRDAAARPSGRGRADAPAAGGRRERAQDADRGHGRRALQRRSAVARHRARSAGRDLGAPPRRHLRAGRGAGSGPPAGRRRPTGSSCSCAATCRASGPARPSEIADWAGLPPRQVNELLEGMELRRFRDEAGGLLVDLPRLAAARRRHAGPAALPAHLGRDAARPLPGAPRSCPSSTAPRSSAQDAAVDRDLHGRRAGGGHLAAGTRTGSSSPRSARLSRAARAELDAEAERLALLHA